tara:strand:+ start:404 stop:583 length:180 start_codon:yes stop_codon:yes gene_type:complete
MLNLIKSNEIIKIKVMKKLRKIIMNPVTGFILMTLGLILLMFGNNLGLYLLVIGFVSTI